MPPASVKDQIKKLVELQSYDAEIYNFNVVLKEKPLELEALKNAFESSKIKLKGLEDKLKTVQVERKGKELEMQSKEEAIAKASAQLSTLKTNKEYHAKQSEIESIKADKSLIEEAILRNYDEADAVTALIDKEKSALANAEQVYLSQKKEIENDVKELQEKLAQLDVKRKVIIPEIDKNSLSRYERILEHSEGLAIVPIKSNACGGCYMNIPQQAVNELKMHDHLVYCEMCARIIYLEDDL